MLKQAKFSALYRSTNIHDIAGQSFDAVYCAGAPAQKWLANKDPAGDLARIKALIAQLQTVRCRQFVLISTVDVFGQPQGVDEHSPVEERGLHAYGLHRRMLEQFVMDHFPSYLIVRLPGLVGPGLRKNVIYDLLNDNNLHAVESRNIFQFYPMVNLHYDIQIALNAGLKLIHLTAAPVSVADIAQQGFGRNFTQQLSGPLVRYDLRTRHEDVFGCGANYQYSARETIQAVRAYAQSEPLAAAAQDKASA